MKRPHIALHYTIAAVHLLFALAVFHRPYLDVLLPSFASFDSVAPWLTWGWGAGIIALLLVVCRSGSVLVQIAHFLSSVYFFMVAGTITVSVGSTPGTATFTVLAFASLVLFAADLRLWMPKVTLMRRLVEHPPQWVVRRRDGRD